jgi:hypothetical protein
VAKLFDRRCSVQIDDLLVEDLRVQFNIVKSLKKHANTADVAIFNLTKDQRSRIKKKGAKVVLKAGYKDSVGVIFKGDTRHADHVHAGPDWITKLQCGDAELSLQYSQISKSFAAGAKVKDVAMEAVKKLNLDKGNAAEKLSKLTATYLQGYTAHGPAANELDQILRSNGLDFSVQDGSIQILGEDETTGDSAVFLDADHGLVGSPEHGTPDQKNGKSYLKIKALLNNRLHPGGRVEIDSETAQGTYRIITLTQKGDTHGGEWVSEMDTNVLGSAGKKAGSKAD